MSPVLATMQGSIVCGGSTRPMLQPAELPVRKLLEELLESWL